MPARDDRQLRLPPMPLRNSEPSGAGLRKEEPLSVDDATRDASDLFDDALTTARLRNQDVAALLSVSESMVQKWRNPERRECPSFAQLLRLPLAFHLALHRALNRRYGFGRAALAQLLEAAGALALAVE
jgi:hypothetical protein